MKSLKTLDDYKKSKKFNTNLTGIIMIAILADTATSWIQYLPVALITLYLIWDNLIYPFVWLHFENKKIQYENELDYQKEINQILLEEKIKI